MAKMTESEFLTKLYADGYKNKLPYPDLKECGGDMLKRDQARAAFRRREGELYEEFRREALEALKMDTHPKADKLYRLAWEDGHAYGFSEVWTYLSKYSELLRD